MKEHILYECGICGSLHRWDFNGDCRDDENRFADEEEYIAVTGALGITVYEVQVRTWDERVEADSREEIIR